jgi:hypothetical protein
MPAAFTLTTMPPAVPTTARGDDMAFDKQSTFELDDGVTPCSRPTRGDS